MFLLQCEQTVERDTPGCVCVYPCVFWSERQERLYCLLPSRQVFSGLQVLYNYRESAHVSMKQGFGCCVHVTKVTT